MKKKFALLMFLFFLFTTTLSAALFPNYDFTFFKSIENTLAVMNSERFGFDYSGYGYVGQTMTTGIYIRLGAQFPYSIFSSLFPSKTNNNENLGDDSSSEETDIDNLNNTLAISASPQTDTQTTPESSKTNEKQKNIDYKFAFSLGPAFRKFISDDALWYMGLGVTGILETNITGFGSNSVNVTNVKIGTEFDIGVRIDAMKKHTSFRVGVYGYLGLLTFSSITTTTQIESNTIMNLTADIFKAIGDTSAFNAVGYISLGHTFRSNDIVTRYRYSNKTNILGAGTKEVIE